MTIPFISSCKFTSLIKLPVTALNPQKDYPVKVFLIEEFFWVENEMELNEK